MRTPNTPTLTFLATLHVVLLGVVTGPCTGVAHANEPPSLEAYGEPLLEDEYEAECGCLDDVAEFVVERGETLSHYASWSGVPVEVIRDDNGLRRGDLLLSGAILTLYVDEETAYDVEDGKRLLQADLRAAYLERHPVVGAQLLPVAPGDSAWEIAHRNAVPLWLLERFNPDLSLEILAPGTDLVVPAVALSGDARLALLFDEEEGC